MAKGAKRVPRAGIDRAAPICRALRHAIIQQALEPGAKLPEDTIGERFGASRTIVRHALDQLAAEGRVELRRNHGATVATPNWDEARDMAALALTIANRGYVLESGRVVHVGEASTLAADPEVEPIYLGRAEAAQ